MLRARVARIPSLKDALPKLATNRGVGAGISEVAFEVEARAKARAPVDEGPLRASIGARRLTNKSWEVTAPKLYAAFQEFGTGQRGRSTDTEYETPPDYVHGTVAGVPAQPFMRPAVEEVRTGLRRAFS